MSDTYQPTQAEFDLEVAGGAMKILRDDGLYRHLHFRLPAGGVMWFDIMTWPGKLVITGDCETYTFARLDDMFEFFRASGARINPGYWQEKVLDGRERARGFDWDRFRMEVLAEFDRCTENREDAERRAEAREDLESELDATEPDEWGAVQLLREYEYRPDGFGTPAYFRFDLSDRTPDGKGWDYHYIWCCRAIAWAIGQYDAARAAATIPTEGA